MAGHSKFKNIQHRKGAQDKKRAKLFTKLVREIITAAKIGGDDVQNNPRLRTAISAGRSQNLPKDRIDKAISQANNADGGDNYSEIRYEGFLPGGIAIIVEALTDNKNRTVAEVRSAFSKHGGNLGEQGAVSFMFDKVGMIRFSKEKDFEKLFELALESGAQELEEAEEGHVIYTDITDFSNCLEKLSNEFDQPEESMIIWRPQNTIIIEDEEKANKIMRLIDVLEDNDDVQNVFGNYELSEELYNKLAQ